MASFNNVVLLGNLTRDVEVRYLASGVTVADLSLAVNNRVKRNGEYVDEPCFIDCSCFNKTAEIAGQYCSKGSQVLVEGTLRLSTWDDRETGAKRSRHSVIVDRLVLTGVKGDRQPQEATGPQQDVNGGGTNPPHSGAEDDVPF